MAETTTTTTNKKEKIAAPKTFPAFPQPQRKFKVQLVEDKHETSSSSSALSYSNITMSCSGAETQEDNEPSTSGCSSFLAHTEKKHRKAEKKERVKEYLKELKLMVKPDGRGGTLSTLQHVLTSMRKMKEGIEKCKIEKRMEQTDNCPSSVHQDLTQTVLDSPSHDRLTCESLKYNEELQVIVSSSDNIVRATSNNFRSVLGCQKDRWIGRLFDDFIYKSDIVTYKSTTRIDNEFCMDISDSNGQMGKSKIVYLRLREFKSLESTGFSLRKQETFKPFQCTFIHKHMCKRELQLEATYNSQLEDLSYSSGISGSAEPSQCQWDSSSSLDDDNLYTVFYCVPIISPYPGGHILPDKKTFEMRQNLFCSFCHAEPNMIPLLGYLPQEVIGVSIFDFFHNDDLQRLFTIFQKVIALKGVPYKSSPIRFLSKNGCWLSCVTEWSSFVNPWSKRLEFIIAKHSVIKAPENVDIFCDKYYRPTIEETPPSVLLARQKIKNLLLQPVETVYLGDNEKGKGKHSRTSVVIADETEVISPSDAEVSLMNKQQDTLFPNDCDKAGLHGRGILFKENAISRAYEQLSYTSCIKKFLLSQPHSFSSESDNRKSSSEDGFDEDTKICGKSCRLWLTGSSDDISTPKRALPSKSEETRSLPALNDTFWNKRLISSDSEFDFDISVPKPPSFGSSTKVLVSEQEHRDLENLLDPVNIREQLQHPTPAEIPTSKEPTKSDAGVPPVMNLTRESLLKHTVIQEQLYLASASPERSILFMNESKDLDAAFTNGRPRQMLKRIHSPDMSAERCKASRRNESGQFFMNSVLNPVFPLTSFDSSSSLQSCLSQSTRMVVPMQMYPIVSVQSASQTKNSKPVYATKLSGMTFRQGEMMGFQSSSRSQSKPNVGLPIPVHRLNSYLMQQGNLLNPPAMPRPRMKQEREKGKTRAAPIQSSSESSSTEDTGSSLYMLENSTEKIKMTYNQLVMQSLAQQMMPQKGLDPAPWLGYVNFNENVQYRYQLHHSKPKRLMKKFREDMTKFKQPDMVLDQLGELLEDCQNKQGPLLDEENDYLFFNSEGGDCQMCSCMEDVCCRGRIQEDHGISAAMKSFRRRSKKKDKRVKKASMDMLQDASVQTETDFKMDTAVAPAIGPLMEVEVTVSLEQKQISECQKGEETKMDCGSSNKSQGGESDIQFDEGSDSVKSNLSSDITPSDQHSNNENGSSLKESDGDAMSRKSDSSSSDKQVTSESDSESKLKISDDLFNNLFTSLYMCFPHSHKHMVPWLADVDFDEDIKMKFHMDAIDKESVLARDRERLAQLAEPDLVTDQLSALIEDIQSANIDIASVMLSSEAISMESDDKDIILVD